MIELTRRIDDHGRVTLTAVDGLIAASWPDIDTAKSHARAMLFGASNPEDARAIAGVLGVVE